jgi:1-acyl-sn-glycerol-3-phosphate acyltransferase
MYWRLAYFGLYTARIVFEIWLKNRLLGENLQRSMQVRRRWANRLLPAVGIHITIEGMVPSTPCLLVANHISYIDPILILQSVDAFPVAMSGMANWPILGNGAKMAGILYLDRADKSDRTAMLSKIATTIRGGNSVLLFPEGTTSDLMDATLPFKKGSFLMAARQGIPVVPVALKYGSKEDAWVEQESFLTHARRRFKADKIEVTLVYGAALPALDAEQLCSTAQEWIHQQLKSRHD